MLVEELLGCHDAIDSVIDYLLEDCAEASVDAHADVAAENSIITAGALRFFVGFFTNRHV